MNEKEKQKSAVEEVAATVSPETAGVAETDDAASQAVDEKKGKKKGKKDKKGKKGKKNKKGKKSNKGKK